MLKLKWLNLMAKPSDLKYWLNLVAKLNDLS
jgi:hypothetical protein